MNMGPANCSVFCSYRHQRIPWPHLELSLTALRELLVHSAGMRDTRPGPLPFQLTSAEQAEFSPGSLHRMHLMQL